MNRLSHWSASNPWPHERCADARFYDFVGRTPTGYWSETVRDFGVEFTGGTVGPVGVAGELDAAAPVSWVQRPRRMSAGVRKARCG